MATRWAICGTGNIANDFCVTLKMQPESEHQIVAVASRTAEKAAKFAERFGIPQSFGSYEEMSVIDNVDIVYIGTVTSAHVENSLLFINAGKSVLCETPMALSQEGCQKVLNAAREKGVFFLEGYWTLFNPVYDLVSDVIKSGDLGEVRMLQGSFSIRLVDCPVDLPRAYQVELGGGVFMEMGGYQLKVANLIFGEDSPEAVRSDFWKSESGVDSCGAFILRYSGGRFAVMTLTDDTPMEETWLVVRGTKGTLKIPEFHWSPTTVVLPTGKTKEFPMPEVPDGYSYMYPRGQLMKYQVQAVKEALSKGLKECPKAPISASEASTATMMKVLEQNNIKYQREIA